jgi:hypothetical protein
MLIKNYKLIGLVLMLTLAVTSSSVMAKKKLAQTGFQFLSVGSDARAAAMGEAYTISGVGANALFYNPAGLSGMTTRFDLSVNYNTWIADINHSSCALAYSPSNGQYGVFGVSLNWVNYGDFEGTMVWSNAQGYVDTEIFSPTAISIGLGYAKSLTDRFFVGGQVKHVAQSLGRSITKDEVNGGLETRKNIASVLALDFGTIFKTGYKSLAFGMSVRNFSQEFKYEEEGFQLPLTFKMGISMNVLDFYEMASSDHHLIVAIDAVHPRSYPEFVNFGFDYTFMDIFSLRAGYVSNQDEYDISYGFGIKKFGLAFDYAYTPFGVFENVQRITARFSL